MLDDRALAEWPERFISKVDVSDECWEWTAYRDKRNGYGKYNRGHGQGVGWAHRVGLELLGIELDRDLETDHNCRNRGCVRPSHLEQVTGAENTRRGRSCNDFAGMCRANKHLWIEDNIVRIGAKRQAACKPCLDEKRRRKATAEGKLHNGLKTHCKNGHLFDEANTFIRKTGHRDCRACNRDRMRRKDRRRA